MFLALFFCHRFCHSMLTGSGLRMSGSKNIYYKDKCTGYYGTGWHAGWFSHHLSEYIIFDAGHEGRAVVMTAYSQAVRSLISWGISTSWNHSADSNRLLVGLLLNNSWLTFLYYVNGVASGFSDPIFGKDVSFYLLLSCLRNHFCDPASYFGGVPCFLCHKLHS